MKCPQCGKEISDKSIYCNKCGTKINSNDSKPIKNIEVKKSQSNLKKFTIKKVFIFLVIVIVMLVAGFARYEYIQTKNFNNLVTSANLDFESGKYKQAIQLYEDALTYKKDENVEIQLSKAQKANTPIIIKYKIDNGYIISSNYSNGSSIQVKLGQTIKLDGTISSGSSQRVLFDSNVMQSLSVKTIKAKAVGSGDINIIPDGYDWNDAYKYHIIVSK